MLSQSIKFIPIWLGELSFNMSCISREGRNLRFSSVYSLDGICVGYYWFWPLHSVLRLVSRYLSWSPASSAPVVSCTRNVDQVTLRTFSQLSILVFPTVLPLVGMSFNIKILFGIRWNIHKEPHYSRRLWVWNENAPRVPLWCVAYAIPRANIIFLLILPPPTRGRLKCQESQGKRGKRRMVKAPPPPVAALIWRQELIRLYHGHKLGFRGREGRWNIEQLNLFNFSPARREKESNISIFNFGKCQVDDELTKAIWLSIFQDDEDRVTPHTIAW